MQIAQLARKHKDSALHNLHGYIDIYALYGSYKGLNRQSASGVDGERWESYGKGGIRKMTELLTKFKKGTYRAPKVRRVYINKDSGGTRPLGIPTIEDKILQTAVRGVLEPVYEQEFKEFSYGFRPGRSQHQAIDYLFKEVSFGKIRYVIDADIRNFFGEINHGLLRSFLDLRVKDGLVRKMIDKWLKAGIMESGQVTYPVEGTPQGGSISPLLSNIYLHYVLDTWYSEVIQPLLKGRGMIVRYADDFVLGFSELEDAKRVFKVLPKRFEKYGLRIHPEKTKLIDLAGTGKGEDRGFDFLGFTHYLGKSRKGYKVLKRKTSRKKFTGALRRMTTWIKRNRNMRAVDLIAKVNIKLRGHYNYYGITFNSNGIRRYYLAVFKLLHKWLNRRGGCSKNWGHVNNLLKEWQPLFRPKIYHSYSLAKP